VLYLLKNLPFEHEAQHLAEYNLRFSDVLSSQRLLYPQCSLCWCCQ